MPVVISLLIQGGVIWALLIAFSEGHSIKYAQQEAMMILGVVLVTGIIAAIVLPAPLGLGAVVAQAAALFICVEKIGDRSRQVAWRITVWYFVITFTIWLGFEMLSWLR